MGEGGRGTAIPQMVRNHKIPQGHMKVVDFRTAPGTTKPEEHNFGMYSVEKICCPYRHLPQELQQEHGVKYGS